MATETVTGTATVTPTIRRPQLLSNGFWSPTVIGVIVAVLIAFAISGFLLYSGQGKQRMMLERERERDRERSSPYGSRLTSGAIWARRTDTVPIFKLRSSAIRPSWLVTLHPYSSRSVIIRFLSITLQPNVKLQTKLICIALQPTIKLQTATAAVKLQSTSNRIRKLALTVNDPSEKTKTFAHTAIKGYKQSAVKCQVLLPNRSRLTGVRFFFPFSHAFFAISSIWITYY